MPRVRLLLRAIRCQPKGVSYLSAYHISCVGKTSFHATGNYRRNVIGKDVCKKCKVVSSKTVVDCPETFSPVVMIRGTIRRHSGAGLELASMARYHFQGHVCFSGRGYQRQPSLRPNMGSNADQGATGLVDRQRVHSPCPFLMRYPMLRRQGEMRVSCRVVTPSKACCWSLCENRWPAGLVRTESKDAHATRVPKLEAMYLYRSLLSSSCRNGARCKMNASR